MPITGKGLGWSLGATFSFSTVLGRTGIFFAPMHVLIGVNVIMLLNYLVRPSFAIVESY